MAGHPTIEKELTESLGRVGGIRVNLMGGQSLVAKLTADLGDALRIRARGEGNSSVFLTRNGMFLVSSVQEYGSAGQMADREYGIFGSDHRPLPFALAFACISGKYEKVEEAFGHVERVLGGIKEVVVQ